MMLVTYLRAQAASPSQPRVTGGGLTAELPGLTLTPLLAPGVIVMLPAVISGYYIIIL